MLHFIQCYEIICNYYTMYRTLYYTYGQGSLLLGSVHLRGIGHARQGCDKNTNRLSAAVCPSRSCNLRDPSDGLCSVCSAKWPFLCQRVYQPTGKSVFVFGEYVWGWLQFGFLNLANINGGNPRPERVFVYAPWGVLYPITYYVSRFISG